MGQAQAQDVEAWVPRSTFSLRLKQLRHEKRLTVAQAATLCGVARATWSTWERGTHPQNMEEAVRLIADGTGIDRYWLMFGEVWSSGYRSSHPLTLIDGKVPDQAKRGDHQPGLLVGLDT